MQLQNKVVFCITTLSYCEQLAIVYKRLICDSILTVHGSIYPKVYTSEQIKKAHTFSGWQFMRRGWPSGTILRPLKKLLHSSINTHKLYQRSYHYI